MKFKVLVILLLTLNACKKEEKGKSLPSTNNNSTIGELIYTDAPVSNGFNFYSVGTDGKNTRQVTRFNDSLFSPIEDVNYHRYLNKLTYVGIPASGGLTPDYGIYVMNSDGSNNQKIPISDLSLNKPILSKNGTHVFFLGGPLNVDSTNIYSVKLDGTDLTQITHFSNNDTGLTSIDYSPDNSKIYFSAWTNISKDIYVMNSDGSNIMNLTNDAWFQNDIELSDDGLKIVYSAWERDNTGPYDKTELFSIDVNGNNLNQLTNFSTSANGVYSKQGSWSPSSQEIVFLSNMNNNSNEIYLMNANGSNLRRITNDTLTINKLDVVFK